MTKEDKDLLLKDLCARLPYGVKTLIYDEISTIVSVDTNTGEIGVHDDAFTTTIYSFYEIKPYLRPMSSMTEDEEIEYDKTFIHLDGLGRVETFRTFDWLNQHHFDYRGLIEKDLALESHEGMY